MAKLNKDALVARVAARTRLPAAMVRRVLDGVLDEIGAALAQGEAVALRGFGVFDRRHYPARMGVHPHTGEPMEHPERYAPSFRASVVLKRMVRGEGEE